MDIGGGGRHGFSNFVHHVVQKKCLFPSHVNKMSRRRNKSSFGFGNETHSLQIKKNHRSSPPPPPTHTHTHTHVNVFKWSAPHYNLCLVQLGYKDKYRPQSICLMKKKLRGVLNPLAPPIRHCYMLVLKRGYRYCPHVWSRHSAGVRHSPIGEVIFAVASAWL